jgi:hypothetical protein
MLARPTAAAVAPGGRRPTPDRAVFDRGTLLCGLAGHLQVGNGLLAAYTREVLQELSKELPAARWSIRSLTGTRVPANF